MIRIKQVKGKTVQLNVTFKKKKILFTIYSDFDFFLLE